MKILVGSTNPVKIKAVQNAFQQCLPNEHWSIEGLKVNSGVSDQPMSDEETFAGAQYRVGQMLSHPADFYVGLEGGLEHFQDHVQAFAWIYVKGQNRDSFARTSTFILPPKIADLVKGGMELGEADDVVFGTDNSKQKMGAVGLLTKGLTDRAQYYEEAVQKALIPYMNPSLY